MKRFIALFVAALLLGGVAFAEAPASQNVNDFWRGGGGTGVTPPTKVIRVRYARGDYASTGTQPGLVSGQAVVWDEFSNDSSKLPAISLCVVNNALSFAGVLVTDINTSDRTGWIAIEGYCLASIDTSGAVTGHRLNTNTTNWGSFITETSASQTVGVLLTDTGADGLMPVWLD